MARVSRRSGRFGGRASSLLSWRHGPPQQCVRLLESRGVRHRAEQLPSFAQGTVGVGRTESDETASLTEQRIHELGDVAKHAPPGGRIGVSGHRGMIAGSLCQRGAARSERVLLQRCVRFHAGEEAGGQSRVAE
jgi:hypothetical protein